MSKYEKLTHKAGTIRKRYQLSPMEAAWCALWLMGCREEMIPPLVTQFLRIRHGGGKFSA